MECNKDEAIRAKTIAEKKMQDKDFVGARKFALKAQQIFPDLDNISQMLMVCDVHCSAEQKIFGNEIDWYSMLKIQQTADEVTIKKQYRKFALLLHPDKNKFAGAEAAFKLIGEAQRILLDREKRSLHDLKRRASVSRPAAPYRPTHQASRNSNFGVQNNFRANTTSSVTGSSHPHLQAQRQQTQSGLFNGLQTFWTVCPFCAVRYQYLREVVNKYLPCQTCKRSFMAYEMDVQPPGSNKGQPTYPQQKDARNQGTFKVDVKSQETSSAKKFNSFPTGCTSDFGPEKFNGKRKRKQVGDSSKSRDSGSSTNTGEDFDADGEHQAGQTFGCYDEQSRRRSNRQKQQVSYDENAGVDEFVKSSKRAKESGSYRATEKDCADAPKAKRNENACFEENLSNGNEETRKAGERKAGENDCKKSAKVDGDSISDSSTKITPDPEFYVYPDPDFSDFDKIREEECFAVGQVWAAYDTLDAMPRFYARIRKVFSPGFKVRITWLEADPDDENEIKWVNEDLPVSCGKFKHGNSENTEDRLMFSHMVIWEKGRIRDTYKIHPRKGETWALFKNWDINWSSNPASNQNYAYEIVEILSEYAEDVGIFVAYLGKVKGFVSLFCQTVKEGMDAFYIRPGEIFRFSHRVPSFKMTGEERKGVPRGSYELDPACLPTNLEEIDVPEDLKVDASSSHPSGLCSTSHYGVKPVMGSEGGPSAYQDGAKETQLDPNENTSDSVIGDSSAPSASTLEAFETPDPEFYNFEAERSLEKFQVGQIWALYSDEDGLPKYYGRIKKINSHPDVKLYLTWLVSCSQPNNVVPWHDKDMPICCGRFKILKGSSQAYTETNSFSHQLKEEFSAKKNEYVIFPRKGEVWALYKNWNAGISCLDLPNCEYDMVEVIEEDDLRIKVLDLERVGGFSAVFKPQVNGRSTVTKEIPRAEMLRFSHQIPAFKLTEERGGSLRGFWELDPAALPVYFFSPN